MIKKNIEQGTRNTEQGIKLLISVWFFLFFFANTQAQERCVVEDSISVYIFMLEDCLITQFYTLALREIHEEYAPYNIAFIGLFPNRFSKPEAIDSFQQKYQIPFLLKTDYFQTKTQKFGATVTPEVIIYNHTLDEVLYKGRIDNAYYRVGKKRGTTTTADLKDALEAIVRGEPVAVKETEAVGCYINLVSLRSW